MSLSPSRKPDGSDVGVGVVELDPERAALVADRDRLVEPAVADPQLVEHAQGRAGEVAELGVVPLALQLGDHHDRQHDLVLLEALQRPRVGEQHAGVEDVGAAGPADGSAWADAWLVEASSGHGHPSQTGARTPRPVLSSVADGPGRSPRAGVPAPTVRPAEHRPELLPVSRGSCSRKIRASRYGKLPALADAANVRRRGAAGAPTRCGHARPLRVRRPRRRPLARPRRTSARLSHAP